MSTNPNWRLCSGVATTIRLMAQAVRLRSALWVGGGGLGDEHGAGLGRSPSDGRKFAVHSGSRERLAAVTAARPPVRGHPRSRVLTPRGVNFPAALVASTTLTSLSLLLLLLLCSARP
ncbi:unnamed protein product [Lampetra fluviatilis]